MNKEITCLSDLFIEIGGLIKNYEEHLSIDAAKEDKEQLYGINEITKIYPKLSKYILTKAVNENVLPVTWIGNERHFYISDIENFLQTSTQRKNVVDNLTSWRTSEQV